MQHDRRDAVAARDRALESYVREWHPVLCAWEAEPGEWHMVSPAGERYAIIRMLELGGERGYRAVTGEQRDRTLIGYYRTLRAAAWAAHRRWLDGHARAGGVNGA